MHALGQPNASSENVLDTAQFLQSSTAESNATQASGLTTSLDKKISTAVALDKTEITAVASNSCFNSSAYLVGRFYPKFIELNPSDLAYMFPSLRTGGEYIPASCPADQKVAIIIPYRNRWSHLHTLLPVLIPLLMRQNVHFRIFVVEQDSPGDFNKGVLFNAGYLEALNISDFNCFIFHDVDMVPVDDRNPYSCNHSNPIHFAPFVNKFNYKIMYPGLFGGVVGFTREQFRRINGASNMYFGWGAEDDDLRDRVLKMNMTILRRSFATYDMIQHGKLASGWSLNKNRFKVFATRHKRQSIDGLNSVLYKLHEIKSLPLYTWLKIFIDRAKIIESVPKEFIQNDSGDYYFKGT